MNKKGYSPITDFFVYIFFVLIVILFIVLISWTKNDINERTNTQTSTNDAKTALLLFLHKQIDFEGVSMSMAELINLYQMSSYSANIDNRIRSEAIDFFTKTYEGSWDMKIKFERRTFHHAYTSLKGDTLTSTSVQVKIQIPSRNNRFIEVKFIPPRSEQFIEFKVKQDE